jgi:hypothetical protein
MARLYILTHITHTVGKLSSVKELLAKKNQGKDLFATVLPKGTTKIYRELNRTTRQIKVRREKATPCCPYKWVW